MAHLRKIYIDGVETAANDASHEQPTPLEPSTEQYPCEFWVHCSNPYCFKHGCLNALRKQGQGVQS